MLKQSRNNKIVKILLLFWNLTQDWSGTREEQQQAQFKMSVLCRSCTSTAVTISTDCILIILGTVILIYGEELKVEMVLITIEPIFNVSLEVLAKTRKEATRKKILAALGLLRIILCCFLFISGFKNISICINDECTYDIGAICLLIFLGTMLGTGGVAQMFTAFKGATSTEASSQAQATETSL